MKLTKRKAFNFLRSYFDVFNKLQTDEDKLSFLTSIINKQFLNEDPISLKFPVDLAYDSQINAIDSSVKGWLRASNTDLQGNILKTPKTPPRGKTHTDPKEVQEKEKEEVQEKEKLYLYSEKEFLEDWRVIKKEEIKGVSNIPRLSPFELSSFMEVKKFYNRTQIKSAIKALFKQDVIDFSSMHSRPKHLLDNIDKYYTAFLDKDKGLYGKKQKEARL